MTTTRQAACSILVFGHTDEDLEDKAKERKDQEAVDDVLSRVAEKAGGRSEEMKELPEVDTEVVKAKCAKVPRMPTGEERRLHDSTHWPFRDWCEHCQRGRARNSAHRR